jgi:hypothetical protein
MPDTGDTVRALSDAEIEQSLGRTITSQIRALSD